MAFSMLSHWFFHGSIVSSSSLLDSVSLGVGADVRARKLGFRL